MDRMRRNLNGAALVSALGAAVSLGVRATPAGGATTMLSVVLNWNVEVRQKLAAAAGTPR